MQNEQNNRRIEDGPPFMITSADQVLTLLGIYLSDWEHRDSIFWKQIFSYFTASLVVMVLPFIDMWGLKLPESIPDFLFPLVGLILAVIFCIVWNGYLIRLKALSDAYQDLLGMLPKKFRRSKVKEIAPNNELMNKQMAALVCWTMFIALIVIGVALLYFTLFAKGPCYITPINRLSAFPLQP